MVDIIEPKQHKISEVEIMDRDYRKKAREIKIARMRASVLRKQITEAYEVLENIRFDFLGDTMFRDYIVGAKRELEGAMSDFLLFDGYWEKRYKEHRKKTPLEFKKETEEIMLNTPSNTSQGK